MHIGIGIDTGGTYTDAVIYDFDTAGILAKGKARTTKEDLRLGICAALDTLPLDLCQQARLVALSTTLATNACVEGKGGRSKLLLLGTPERVIRHIDAPARYGFEYEDVLCVENGSSFDGEVVDIPDWEQLVKEHASFFKGAQALSIAERNAIRNGGVVERSGRDFLREHFKLPIVMASELTGELNMMERGATALLNARLLPVIEEFLDATLVALEQRGISAPVMIVRSDASLMSEGFARTSPVETIVSGPAASVQGCQTLVEEPDYLVVDIGGTTTDISYVEKGAMSLAPGVRIGNWRAQIPGVHIDTFGLGGDSAVRIGEEDLYLSERRVEPLCVAATRWPQVTGMLENLLAQENWIKREMFELLYLVREPQDRSLYTDRELLLLDVLEDGPMMVGVQDLFEPYELNNTDLTSRLESDGVIMRCGLTPTDIMHIRGDFDAFDTQASFMAAKYLAGVLRIFGKSDEGIQALCDAVYDLVGRKLYTNIARILLEHSHPRTFAKEYPEQLNQMLEEEWDQVKDIPGGRQPKVRTALKLDITCPVPLVGVGAPTHLLLPMVARALGTTCIIPPNAEVANALGAIATRISAQATVEIVGKYSPGGLDGYSVHTEEGVRYFRDKDPALACAQEEALRQAEKRARERGATGELECSVSTNDNQTISAGDPLYLGTKVHAIAREK